MRWAAVVLTAVLSSGVPAAWADISDVDGTNVHRGSNRSVSRQSGVARSGDFIAGQVLGSAGPGSVNVDATNESIGIDGRTGAAAVADIAAAFTGLADGNQLVVMAGISNATAVNLQEGNNVRRSRHTVGAVTGDAVAGQVAGFAASEGSSIDVSIHNSTRDSTFGSGDVSSTTRAAALTGQSSATTTVVHPAEIGGIDCDVALWPQTGGSMRLDVACEVAVEELTVASLGTPAFHGATAPGYVCRVTEPSRLTCTSPFPSTVVTASLRLSAAPQPRGLAVFVNDELAAVL